jgi:hypothetical protein
MEDVSLEKLAAQLQQSLASIPEPRHVPHGRERFFGYLIKRIHALKVKMYQEPGHSLPHIHIDHARGDNHSASYSIDPPKRLEGYLDARSDYIVLNWLATNKDALLTAWQSLQDGSHD